MTVQSTALFKIGEQDVILNGTVFRLLATGSRRWTDWRAVDRTFGYIAGVLPTGTRLIIVHGDCPPRPDGTPGLDQWADRWARSATIAARHPHITIEPEPHPADWNRPCAATCRHTPRSRNGRPYCPAAGNFRNRDMVNLGANLCAGFPLGESTGTRDCMRRARANHIPVWEIDTDPTRVR